MLTPKYKLYFTYITTNEKRFNVIYTEKVLLNMLDKLKNNPYITNIYFEDYKF